MQQPHLYTPMRYVWDQYELYFRRDQTSLVTQTVMRGIRTPLQRWDVSSSKRVHRFIAISRYVADRIRRYYSREAEVIYPPVDYQSCALSKDNDGFYLMVTAFAPYKRVDLAIEAANRLRFRLKIIGSGQEEQRLRRLAGPTVEMLSQRPDHVVRDHYARCKALLFPGEEDFGIVPLEAMACGKPVIAFGKGGAVETVIPINPSAELRTSNFEPPTGVFFYGQTVEALVEAVQFFEQQADRFDPQSIRAHVQPFDRAHFKERMGQLIERFYNEFQFA